jgi:hypothetical protein
MRAEPQGVEVVRASKFRVGVYSIAVAFVDGSSNQRGRYGSMLERKVTLMSNTMRLGWMVGVVHAPLKPHWLVGVDRANELAKDLSLADPPIRQHGEVRRYHYLESARMRREMDRL